MCSIPPTFSNLIVGGAYLFSLFEPFYFKIIIYIYNNIKRVFIINYYKTSI